MSRVSENSANASVKTALNRVRGRMEKLRHQGASLKKVNRPSDDPIGNIDILNISSRLADNEQYIKNAEFAAFNLRTTELALEQLGDIMVRAKELAIGLASDLQNADIRKNIASEVRQLRNQALSLANKRVGQRYLFGGFKTQSRPFDDRGNYNGDRGHITLEVGKDFFVQTNLSGAEVFYANGDLDLDRPLDMLPSMEEEGPPMMSGAGISRSLASVGPADASPQRNGLFGQLEHFLGALERSDSRMIQELLPHFDRSISRIVRLRTKVGALESSAMDSKRILEGENVRFNGKRSRIRDADVAELFSDISQQRSVLRASQQASGNIVNNTLMDFIR